MDFRLTDDQLALQAAARKYARERLLPLADETERTGEPPSAALIREYAHMGFLGINVAAHYGGLGLGNIEALVVLEEFAKVSAALAFPVFESSVGPVRAIERFAEESLRARVVPKVCAGELIVAVSMSEPQAGSALTDPDNARETAWRPGRLEWYKAMVFRWRSRRRLRHLLPDERVTRGGGDRSGLCRGWYRAQLRCTREPYGIPRRTEQRLIPHDCRVPAANVIVPAGGFRKLMEAFDLERCGNATMGLRQAVRLMTYWFTYWSANSLANRLSIFRQCSCGLPR